MPQIHHPQPRRIRKQPASSSSRSGGTLFSQLPGSHDPAPSGQQGWDASCKDGLHTITSHTHRHPRGTPRQQLIPQNFTLPQTHVYTQTLRYWTQLPTEPDTGVCPKLAAGTCFNTPETLHRHRSTHSQKHTGPCSLRTIAHTHPNKPTGAPVGTHRPTHTCNPKLAHTGGPLCTHIATPASPPISPRAVQRRTPSGPHPPDPHTPSKTRGLGGSSFRPPPSARFPWARAGLRSRALRGAQRP